LVPCSLGGDKYSVKDSLSPTEYVREVIVLLVLAPVIVMEDSKTLFSEDIFFSTFFSISSPVNWQIPETDRASNAIVVK
jgi:hypothetical protein